MQRAAASTSKSLLPDDKDRSLDANFHSSKRQKIISEGVRSPTAPNTHPKQLSKARDEEEAKRGMATGCFAEDAGDTRWELSTFNKYDGAERDNRSQADMQITTTAYSEIDSQAHHSLSGRKTFGKYHSPLKVALSSAPSLRGLIEDKMSNPQECEHKEQEEKAKQRLSSMDTFSELGADGGMLQHSSVLAATEDPTYTLEVPALPPDLNESRAQKVTKDVEMKRLGQKRKKKEVKMNKLSSISVAGGGARLAK